MNYCIKTAASHLSNVYWYLDTGEMQPGDLTAEYLTVRTKRGFIIRWDKLSAS